MKKITLLGSIIVLLLFSCVANAQDRRPFHIIPLVPVVGQDVKFTYDNSLTPQRVHLGGEKALFRAVFKPRFRWGNIKTLTRPENAL